MSLIISSEKDANSLKIFSDISAERIKFKLATYAYRCLRCTAPRYLSAQLTMSLTFVLVGVFVHLPLTLHLSVRRGLSLSVIGRFRLRLPTFGMNFPATSPLPCLWRLSVVSLKLFASFIISGFIICTSRHLCKCSLYINIMCDLNDTLESILMPRSVII